MSVIQLYQILNSPLFYFAQELIGKVELSPCKKSKPSWTRQHRTLTCPQKKNKPYYTTFSQFCSRLWRPSLSICGKLSHARQLLLSFTLLRFTHLSFLFTPPSFSAAKTACSSYSTMQRDWFQTWLTRESYRYLTPSTLTSKCQPTNQLNHLTRI